MQAGIVYGYAGLVDGIVQNIAAEMGTTPGVIGTGGSAGLISSESKAIESVDEFLTLKGLKLIYDRNS